MAKRNPTPKLVKRIRRTEKIVKAGLFTVQKLLPVLLLGFAAFAYAKYGISVSTEE